jgi:hypothetical protein
MWLCIGTIGCLSDQLILYREIVTVCSEIHAKHTNALCGQNVEYLRFKFGGI